MVVGNKIENEENSSIRRKHHLLMYFVIYLCEFRMLF